MLPSPLAGEGLGERGDLCSTVAITASRPEQTSGFGHVLPQGFYEFVFNHCPSPQPLPRKGGRGDHRCQRLAIEQSPWRGHAT